VQICASHVVLGIAALVCLRHLEKVDMEKADFNYNMVKKMSMMEQQTGGSKLFLVFF